MDTAVYYEQALLPKCMPKAGSRTSTRFNVLSWYTCKASIKAGFVTVFCSMSAVSKTPCSHFSSKGSYYTTHANCPHNMVICYCDLLLFLDTSSSVLLKFKWIYRPGRLVPRFFLQERASPDANDSPWYSHLGIKASCKHGEMILVYWYVPWLYNDKPSYQCRITIISTNFLQGPLRVIHA